MLLTYIYNLEKYLEIMLNTYFPFLKAKFPYTCNAEIVIWISIW